jgi:general secretion pathway protein D
VNHSKARARGRSGAWRRAPLRHAAWCAAIWACVAGGVVQAQQELLYTANYREADIRMVVEQVQQVIGRPIIIDPRVRAQLTVLSNAPMPADAFYQTFLAALEVHGFIPLESGDTIMIVPDSNARFGAGDDYVTQAIILQNIGAAQLVPILRPLLPQSAHLASHQVSNSLIIADRPQNIRRMIELVRRMDQAGTEDVEVIQLENASADEVVRMLGQLNTAAQAVGGAPPIQIIADPRTNSVLLSGTGSVKLKTRAVIAHLDTPTAEGGDTLVRYLNYADAEDLATKLQAQFGGGGSGAPTAPGADGGPPAQTGPVTIWADAGTNALIISAPERIRADMLAIINQLDIQRLQVQVDAIIVELSEQETAALGVTWLRADDEFLGITNFSNAGGGGILGLAGAAAGDTPNLSAIAEGITIGIGKLSGPGGWAALLNALRGEGETNIISTPQIVTLDNEEAEIRVGQEVPFVTGQFTNTGANQGSVNPFQTIQREEVGTSLKITPQIEGSGNGVKLEIEQETSSLGAAVEGAADLVTNTRTIMTSVFVNDGDVLILGGLIDDQLREQDRRVPGLGRVPGFGWLFRARNTDRTKTNLMVFIRPTILRNAQDARFQTNTKYRYIQDLQRQMADDPVLLMRDRDRPQLPPLSQDQAETVLPNAAPPDGAESGSPPDGSESE